MADRLDPLRTLARRVPFGMAAGRWLHRVVDPDLRERERLLRSQGQDLLQPFTDTAEDRYPELFDAIAERLAHLPEPRILSFGCASGAELCALRRRMPGARLTGIDINPREIARARRADPQSDYRITAAPLANDRFDAILALAVLRDGRLEHQKPDDCSAILPFARFERALAGLDAVLEPGGLLAVWHAHFRFADTGSAVNYEADRFRMPEPGQDLLWGPDNRRLDEVSEPRVLFRKRPV